MTTIPARSVYIQISDLIGIPWKHRGRTLTGLDCLGLVKLSLQRLREFEFPDYTYDETWYDSGYDHFAQHWRDVFVPVKKLDVGDVCFFKIHRTTVTHAAIHLGNDCILHTLKKTGVLITPFEKFARFFQFAGRLA